MKRSTDRIITTHVGSLARPVDLLDIMKEKENDRPYDKDAYDKAVTAAVADRVAQQVANGIDVVTDGEMSKVRSFWHDGASVSGLRLQHQRAHGR